MYKELGGQLPALTRLMMGISNVMKGYWFVVFPALILLVWADHPLEKHGARPSWLGSGEAQTAHEDSGR